MQHNTLQLWLLSRLVKRRTQQKIVTALALVILVVVYYQVRSKNSSKVIQSSKFELACHRCVHSFGFATTTHLPPVLHTKSQTSQPTNLIDPLRTIKLPSVCSNESCRADYIKHLHRPDLLPIPAIRHIVWRNETVSEYMAEQLRSWVKIHPNWTFVLWRDQDLEVFVAAYFPLFLQKFKSLPEQIMRVDAIRYLLLFKYGGVYADLDYTLVKSIEEFRHFHAVVTREPENHSFHHFAPITWPLKPLPNVAFMMSAPGHMLFHYAIQKLKSRASTFPVDYAGPFAMIRIMDDYQSHFSIVNHAMESVYMPPSFSFYPYLNNRLNTSKSYFLLTRILGAKVVCGSMMSSKDAEMMKMNQIKNLTDYCSDVNNMDPITDKSQPVYAIHDLKKTGEFYYGHGTKFYVEKPLDMRKVISNLILGKDFLAL